MSAIRISRGGEITIRVIGPEREELFGKLQLHTTREIDGKVYEYAEACDRVTLSRLESFEQLAERAFERARERAA